MQMAIAMGALGAAAAPKEQAAGKPGWKNDDFSWIRGANYTPSYAPNDVVIWRDFDAAVVDRELGYAADLGLNSVRTFLNYIVYEADPEGFARRFESYLALCERHGLRAMPVLFDSCFGQEPTLDWNGHWVMNPGTSREHPDFWPKLEPYIEVLVGRHRGDERVAIWDIMNEPVFSPGTVAFVKHWSARVRDIDSTHPVTVSVAGGLAFANAFADDQDVIAMHSYSFPMPMLRYQIDLMLDLGRAKGKPVIITEFGMPGSGQSYEDALGVLRETGIGWYFWELMIAATQFRNIQGVLYPDGSCRRKSTVAAIRNVDVSAVDRPEKPDAEGVPIDTPGVGMAFDGDYLEKLRLMAQTPTTPEDIEQRIAFVLPSVITFGSVAMLTLPEIQSIFGAWGKLARWKEEKPETVCREVDAVCAALAAHIDEIDATRLVESK